MGPCEFGIAIGLSLFLVVLLVLRVTLPNLALFFGRKQQEFLAVEE
jgi:hypothetical protein